MGDAIFRSGPWNGPYSSREVELWDGRATNLAGPLAGEECQPQHAACTRGDLQAVQTGPESPNFVVRKRSVAALFGIELKACGGIDLYPALANAPAVYATDELY